MLYFAFILFVNGHLSAGRERMRPGHAAGDDGSECRTSNNEAS